MLQQGDILFKQNRAAAPKETLKPPCLLRFREPAEELSMVTECEAHLAGASSSSVVTRRFRRWYSPQRCVMLPIIARGVTHSSRRFSTHRRLPVTSDLRGCFGDSGLALGWEYPVRGVVGEAG